MLGGMLLLLSLLQSGPLLAADMPTAEVDQAFSARARWSLGEHRLELRGNTLWVDGEARIVEVVDDPVFGGDRLFVPADTPDRAGRVVEVRLGVGGVVVEDRVVGGRPDRLAVSASGKELAFVSGRSGYASVWLLKVHEAAPPVQLTNLGLEPTPGQPPKGWTPPPDGPPRFAGDRITWDSPYGPGELRWR